MNAAIFKGAPVKMIKLSVTSDDPGTGELSLQFSSISGGDGRKRGSHRVQNGFKLPTLRFNPS